MLRISKHTRLKPADVIDRASRFFGSGGEGLDETQRTPCCISFEGAGGHVTVSVADEENRRSVDIETREFEYPAKKFLGKL